MGTIFHGCYFRCLIFFTSQTGSARLLQKGKWQFIHTASGREMQALGRVWKGSQCQGGWAPSGHRACKRGSQPPKQHLSFLHLAFFCSLKSLLCALPAAAALLFTPHHIVWTHCGPCVHPQPPLVGSGGHPAVQSPPQKRPLSRTFEATDRLPTPRNSPANTVQLPSPQGR